VAAVGTKLAFTPYRYNSVSIYDTANGASHVILTGADVSSDEQYQWAATLGTNVYFSPFDADHLLWCNLTDDTCTRAVSGSTQNGKFGGVAAVGTKIIYAPYMLDYVGILDTTSNTFSSVPISTHAVGDKRFNGAVGVGTKAVLVPFKANEIGIFDVSTNSASTRSCPGASGTEKFWGGAAVGTVVVFAPYDNNAVGLFDVDADNYWQVTHTTTGEALSGQNKWRGATAMGTKVIFAPWDTHQVGIFDVPQNSFTLLGMEGSTVKYSGAAHLGGRVWFAPGEYDYVGYKNLGILDYLLGSPEFPVIGTTGRDGTGSKTRRRRSSRLYGGVAVVGLKAMNLPESKQ